VNEHIVIVTGASTIDPAVTAHLAAQLSPEARVIAVDGGLDHALAAGLTPTELVGDLDSVSETGLAWAARHATITRHPTDKDQTDTELALALAAASDPARITLIGGGDRLDHTLAAIGALGAPMLTSVPVVDGWWAAQHVRVLHGPDAAELTLRPGSTLSLLALHGACTNVALHGTRWELEHHDLDPVVGVGVSNVVGDDGVVSVSLSTGVLTVFDEPHAASPSPTPHEETT
jgi:thiamine pyrophosphokinase